MKPKVSIIVPVYQVAAYLPRCIDSILAQTFTDFEVILVDDGSRDASGSICDAYAGQDERVRVVHKKNGGLTSARNAGLEQAHGEWVMHVDGDDWIEPDMLACLLAKAREAEADVVIGDFRFVYAQCFEVYRTPEWTDDKRTALARYITSTWTCLWGGMQKRALYEAHGLRSPQSVTYCEDFHLIVRLCYFANRVAHVARPLYNYRQQDTSIMHNLNKRTERDEQWVYQDIIRFFQAQGVYEDYRRPMCWRMLKASQELVLDRQTWPDFRAMVPEKKRYIWTCPYINWKLKLNMWGLTHGMPWVSALLLKLRTLRHG